MQRATFVINRDHVKAPLRRLRKLPSRKRVQVIANHNSQVTPLLAIHGGMRGFHVTRGASLDFDETEHVFLFILRPSDQIDLATMTCRAKIPRDYYVTSLAQEEVRVFLSTAPSEEMRGSFGVRLLWDKSVKSAEKTLRDAA